jgi:hypothetical protein
MAPTASSWPAPHYRGFTITLRHTTFGTTPLNEWSAWRRDLYLTTHNTYKRQTSTPPAGFEPANPASERPQTHTLRQRGHWDRHPPFGHPNMFGEVHKLWSNCICNCLHPPVTSSSHTQASSSAPYYRTPPVCVLPWRRKANFQNTQSYNSVYFIVCLENNSETE